MKQAGLFARRVVVFLGIVLGLAILWKSCALDESEIRTTDWKYNDEGYPVCSHCDFLHLNGGTMVLRSDTIFRADTAIAVVECAYHKWMTYDRLLVKSLSSDRVVEYVAI